jgi:hypothetical protein
MRVHRGSRAACLWLLVTSSPTSLGSVSLFFSLYHTREHAADKRITSDNEGKWGMRIESALVVRRVKVRVLIDLVG